MNFTWPSWVGTPSQFGLLLAFLATVLVAYIKVWPKLKELDLTAQAKKRSELYQQINELKNDVIACQDNCDKQEVRLRAKIDALQEKLSAEAINRVQSEISLVNTLIQVVDAPQLRIILGALEKRQILLNLQPPQPRAGADEDETGVEDEG